MSHFDEGGLPSRGATYYGPSNTIDTANYGESAKVLGSEKWFNDMYSPGSGATTARRSYRKVLCRLVRNVSGVTLLPKMAVNFKAGTKGQEVDGYARTTGAGNYAIVDEHLSSAGVRNGDVFWVVIKGPTLVKTTLAAADPNVINQGDLVVVATAAASTHSATAGRFEVFALQSPTSAAAALYNHNQSQNALGRAMSAMTTANTDTNLLVDAEYHR